MKEKLIQFLSTFPELSQEDIEIIAENIPVVTYPKGAELLREGEIPSFCYYVLQGIVLQYQIKDGDEKTIAFYTEKNGAISSSHYVHQKPYNSYLVCAEDCLLIQGNAKLDLSNYEKFPILKTITSKMLENDLNETKQKFASFVISTPKERYLNLMQSQPELLNRVPQHQIASYLGITPESLSRIRKRIVSEA